ncbi:branched-chain amino acid transport system II carrier protein [Haloimpatiens sp. FM7330]|uniref:branched-chain amino acid transport system II carrier protein n=1 Tax=Haloimpatiens sp. FM7330 TaxID=3298610 RepID=UPI003643A644
MNKRKKDTIIVGMALFAMFFGAGNLIFPPALGMLSGENWIVCGLGFFLTAVGMPLIGMIAVSKAGGTIDDVGNKVNPTFSKIFSTIVILAIGPLLAIPRTGATTFEMGIKPIFPNVNPIIISIIFFSLTLYFVIKPSEIVDKVAKILTPILLIIIFIIIIKGIISPIGNPSVHMNTNPFSKGFTEGYQTMDALASLVFGGVILNSIMIKGYTEEKEQIKLTIRSSVIAAIGLAVVYGGLMYLGASANTIFAQDIQKTDLLIGITHNLFGNAGKIALGIVVSLACLTTSIGLTATVGCFFNKLTNDKISYQLIVIITVIFSGIFAITGVEKIVSVAVPMLVTVYPIAIVLILMNAFNNYIPKNAYVGAVLGALLVSLYDGITVMNIKISFLTNIINKIPFVNYGFGWLIPSIIGGIITTVILKNKSCLNNKFK